MAKFKQSSNLYKLLRGLAPTYRTMDGIIQRLVDQSVPPETEDFLSEWEVALGIPDQCFPLASNDDARRRNIGIKLAVLAGISTADDFVYLASLFGLVVTVGSGIDHVATGSGGYGTKTPALTIPGDFANVATARMTMVVVESTPDATSFPYDYPIPFTTTDILTMRCLFRKLVPANVNVLFTS